MARAASGYRPIADRLSRSGYRTIVTELSGDRDRAIDALPFHAGDPAEPSDVRRDFGRHRAFQIVERAARQVDLQHEIPGRLRHHPVVSAAVADEALQRPEIEAG
jgi:hypothetical protein